MAFELRRIGKFTSLEFSGGDHARLWAALEARFGGFRWTRPYREIEFGGALFIYVGASPHLGGETFSEADDWGTPAIISQSIQGDEVLETLSRHLDL